MTANRRKQLVVGSLFVILAFAGYRMWLATSASPVPSSNGTAARSPGGRKAAAAPEAPDVHLTELESARPHPLDANRNLFRFKVKPPPPPPPPPVRVTPTPPVVVENRVPAGPPPPPPITLKFIGIVEVLGKSERFAILSDGRGLPMQGKEGDIIEGRYRILKIGNESIEMAYLDGRGRQTIRLTGG
jgi:hypothetical protein